MARKSKKSPGAGQSSGAYKATNDLSASGDPINEITLLYRDYSFAQEQRKRMDLALGAYLRRALGWQKDLPEKERKAIAKEAAAISKEATGTRFESMVNAQTEGRACFDVVEANALKAMVKLAERLPVWESWGKNIRGFGAKSLAVIVAEAGDLSNYPDKSKLWKRMGLAVMGDVRQGGLTKGAGAEAWIEHGYSPKRRSQIWNVGDTMIKAQVRKVKDEADDDSGERMALGEYGQAYLDRKAYELARDPEMQPIKAHRRAQRYMEKRLLRDLWKAWRRSCVKLDEKPYPVMTAAEITDAAQAAGQALLRVPATAETHLPDRQLPDAPQGAGETVASLHKSAFSRVSPHEIQIDELHEFIKRDLGFVAGIGGGGLDGAIFVVSTGSGDAA